MGADSVVEAGRRVFLRRNSNISTGGDSADFTDEMPETYKRVAERAAEAVGARVSGVDMIVPDVSDGSAEGALHGHRAQLQPRPPYPRLPGRGQEPPRRALHPGPDRNRRRN